MKHLKNRIRGTYCEFQIKEVTRFLEIHFCEYSPDTIKRLEEIDALSESMIGGYLNLINEQIPSNTKYLYKLISYVGDPTIKDAWEFGEKVEEYEERGFIELDDLLIFCKSKWGRTEQNFVPQSETSIP